jgi:hypothetical protein
MRWFKLILVCLPLCFCSCLTISDIKNSVNNLALPQPTKPVYYAGVANMRLYPGPTFEGGSSGKVPLNEKLVLLKAKHTWAFVEVARTGSTGWVETTYLERKPIELKKCSKAKKTGQEDQETKKATGTKSEGEAEKSALDLLQPGSAIAAPEGAETPTGPQAGADAFDAF